MYIVDFLILSTIGFICSNFMIKDLFDESKVNFKHIIIMIAYILLIALFSYFRRNYSRKKFLRVSSIFFFTVAFLFIFRFINTGTSANSIFVLYSLFQSAPMYPIFAYNVNGVTIVLVPVISFLIANGAHILINKKLNKNKPSEIKIQSPSLSKIDTSITARGRKKTKNKNKKK